MIRSLRSSSLLGLVVAVALHAAAQTAIIPDPSASAAPAPDRHTLNLKDADIHVLIATVGEITGKNFVVDPRVQGKVNVISNQPLGRAELYDMFLSILRVNGYSAVPDGAVVRIVPEQSAPQDGAVPLSEGRRGDEFVTRIVTLKHLSPADVMSVLRPLMPANGQILAHVPSSSLILADRASSVARLERIIERLDTAAQSDIEVLALGHANAAELVRTLNQLNPTGQGETTSRLVADERTNSVILSGDRSRRLKLKALIAHLDTPLPGTDSMEVLYLRYAKAEEMVPILEGVLRGDAPLAAAAGAAPAPSADGAKTVIQAHRETNALVLTGPPAVLRSLRDVVRKLDVRRAQVLIEAIIAEVSDEAAKEIGIQWQATESSFTDRGVIGGTNYPASGAGIVGATVNPLAALGGSAGLSIGYVLGTTRLPGSDDEILRLGALARALSADNKNNVLSTPSTVTLDHEPATLSVGQEVPFLTGQYTTGATTSAVGTNPGTGQPGAGLVNPFQTIERREVGLKLNVTPHINEGDTVVLDIELEASSLAPTTRGAVDLITNSRKLSTRVMVRDRGLLVLGGLTSEETKETEQRVPGLGRLPVLGELFKYRSSQTQRRHLMVFLRPTIARDSFTEDVLSSEKYNFIRAEQLKARQAASMLTPAERVPVLPELRDFLQEGIEPRSEAPSAPAVPSGAPAAPPSAPVLPPSTPRAEALAPPPPPATPLAPVARGQAQSAPRYALQLGSFAQIKVAEALIQKVEALGLGTEISLIEAQGRKLYRVRTRPYAARAEAVAVLEKLKREAPGVEAMLVELAPAETVTATPLATVEHP